MRVCWMLSSAGEARIAVPAGAQMARHGIESVYATWLTECARFLFDNGVKEPVYVPDRLDTTTAESLEELGALGRRYPIPGIAALAFAEMRARYLDDRDALVPLAAGYLRFWERFLRDQRIDAVLCWTSSNVACRSAWSVAKANGLPALIVSSGPTFDHFSLVDRGEETVWSELLDAVASGVRPLGPDDRQRTLSLVQQTRARHGRFKPRPTSLVPADVIASLKKTAVGRAAGWGMRTLGLRKPSPPPKWAPSSEAVAVFPDRPDEIALLARLQGHLERRRATWTWLTRLGWLRYGEADFVRPYVYFPMQQEVGARLAGQAPAYSDQIALAEWIAQAMPAGHTLYVKEHPTHPGIYDWRRLRRLGRLPNVVVVHPHTDNARLVEGAAAIVCVSSTAGWEGFLARRPVVALARCYYTCSDLVFSVQNLNDLPGALRRAVEAGPGLYERREEEWLWFIDTVVSTALPGSAFGYKKLFEVLEAKEEDNGTLIGRGIVRKLLGVPAAVEVGA